MTVPSTYRASSANGWLEVFGSANKRPGEVTAGKEIARQLKSVTQAVPADPPEGTPAGNILADEARHSRGKQISEAIDSISKAMPPSLQPLFCAFRIIGVGHDDALRQSLDIIDRAATQMKDGNIDAARKTLQNALGKLAPGNPAGDRTPPASASAAPGSPKRLPGA